MIKMAPSTDQADNVKMKNLVQGKVCLVTGSNRGIGKAIVEGFLTAGASKVYAAARDLKSLQTVTFEGDTPSQDGPNRVVPIYIDLSEPSSIEEAAKIASDVHIVVINAGILFRRDALADDAVDKLQQEMEVNVYGLMHLSKAFEATLKKNVTSDCGTFLVQINSVASMRCSSPTVSTYSASKAASFSVTQAIQQTWKNDNNGIHVVSVHPGPISSRMIADLGDLKELAEPPSVVADAIVHAINSWPNTTFLVYPDEMSSHLGEKYASYAKEVIEGGKAYGDYKSPQEK